MQVRGVGRRQARKLHTAYHQHVEGGPCVTGAFARGWTAVMLKQPAPPKEIMVESVVEYAQIIAAAREVLQRWRRYQRTGILAVGRGKLAQDARFVIQTVRYALRLWIVEDAWSGYYEVRSGAVHNCMACRTIDPVHTHFRPIPHLSGLEVEEVAAKGYKMCMHCYKRPKDETVHRVERMVDWLCVELEAIAVACSSGAA